MFNVKNWLQKIIVNTISRIFQFVCNTKFVQMSIFLHMCIFIFSPHGTLISIYRAHRNRITTQSVIEDKLFQLQIKTNQLKALREQTKDIQQELLISYTYDSRHIYLLNQYQSVITDFTENN